MHTKSLRSTWVACLEYRFLDPTSSVGTADEVQSPVIYLPNKHPTKTIKVILMQGIKRKREGGGAWRISLDSLNKYSLNTYNMVLRTADLVVNKTNI